MKTSRLISALCLAISLFVSQISDAQTVVVRRQPYRRAVVVTPRPRVVVRPAPVVVVRPRPVYVAPRPVMVVRPVRRHVVIR